MVDLGLRLNVLSGDRRERSRALPTLSCLINRTIMSLLIITSFLILVNILESLSLSRNERDSYLRIKTNETVSSTQFIIGIFRLEWEIDSHYCFYMLSLIKGKNWKSRKNKNKDEGRNIFLDLYVAS